MSDTPQNPADTPAQSPAELVRSEAEALQELALRLEGEAREPFDRMASQITDAVRQSHRVMVTGVGKSGLIGRKIAATLVSTGTPAHFFHPGDALHGDLGVLTPGDILLALSYSGETEELLRLLPILPRMGVTLVSFTGCPTSTLASASSITLDVSVSREACNHQLAPTASTTAMLALGDALALDVSQRLNFQPHDFAELHPGGSLGRKLATVRQVMKTGDAVPQVSAKANMPQIIHEMSTKRLGMTTVTTGTKLLGILSDGDLRRLLERNGPYAFHKTAMEVMNPNPRAIAPEAFAVDALSVMEQHKIMALVVTEDGTPATPLVGVIHLHDLWEFAPKTDAKP